MVRARITSPIRGANVGSVIRVQGVVSGEHARSLLWLGHRRGPGGLCWPKEPRIVVDPDGRFSVAVYEGGTAGQIVISLLAVSPETDRYFREWLSKGHRTGDYPGIAVDELGAEELDSVGVVYAPGRPPRIFISYSHEDDEFRRRLEESLASLKRTGAVEPWTDLLIKPGQSVAKEIENALSQADIMLLLVSPSFMASDYCQQIELSGALQRPELLVVPIIIRPTDWEGSPFGGLSALPRNGKPVASWQDPDEAWLDIAKGIRKLVENSPMTG